jgi:biotin carboxylase
LAENGFNCPHAKGYNNAEAALKDVDYFEWPVIVKPVDSAGSKGVTKVEDPKNLQQAIDTALASSISKNFIIEDFLEKEGFSVGSESFVVDGKLLYNGFYDQYFNDEATNPYTPSAEVWPSVMKKEYQEEIKSELQRLVTLLGITTGLFNVECRVCKNGKAYLMEVSPRAGGNRLAEMLNYAADVNINEAETRKAVGLSVGSIHEPNYRGHFAILVLHSDREGIFEGISIEDDFRKKHVIEEEIRVSQGDKIFSFSGANAALGTLFLKFESREKLAEALAHQKKWLKINLK